MYVIRNRCRPVCAGYRSVRLMNPDEFSWAGRTTTTVCVTVCNIYVRREASKSAYPIKTRHNTRSFRLERLSHPRTRLFYSVRLSGGASEDVDVGSFIRDIACHS